MEKTLQTDNKSLRALLREAWRGTPKGRISDAFAEFYEVQRTMFNGIGAEFSLMPTTEGDKKDSDREKITKFGLVGAAAGFAVDLAIPIAFAIAEWRFHGG